jgi:hypothetical protein
MRFFSRLIFIFNLCFVAFVILQYFEHQKQVKGDKGHLIPLPFVEGSLVVLGWGAIFFNLAFCLIVVPMKLAKKLPSVPIWIVWANFIFLLIEIYYHFFS